MSALHTTSKAVPGSPRKLLRAAVEPLSFATAPVFFAACLFASGEWIAHMRWQQPALILTGFALCLVVVCIAFWRGARVIVLPIACAWLCLGVLCVSIQTHADNHERLLSLSDDLRLTVEGEVMRSGTVQVVESASTHGGGTVKEHSQLVDLRLRRIEHVTADVDEMTPIEGGLRMRIYAPVDQPFPPLGCGDAVTTSLVPHEPQRYLDPGVWDGAAYLREQGINVLGSAHREKVIAELRTKRGSDEIPCRIKSIQSGLSDRWMQFADAARMPAFLPSAMHLNHEDAAMLSAMVTGDRTYLSRQVRIGFERTGTFHLLVVSGMHLAIVAGLVFWFAQRLRVPRLWATLATIAVSFAYALLTGFGQPVQRSFWMVTLFLAGRLIFRQRSPLNAIGFAALCLLAWNPRALFDAGFLMTLLSVIAIAGLAAPIAEKTFAPHLRATRDLDLLALDAALPPKIAQFRVSMRLLIEKLRPLCGKRVARLLIVTGLRFWLRVAELLLVSLVVELVMSLPMALYFHRITLLALPVNFVLVPFIGVLLPLALLTLAAIVFLPSMAFVPASLTAALLHGVERLVQTFASLRGGDLRIPGPVGLAMVLFPCLLAFAVWSIRQSRLWPLAACIALVIAAYSVVRPRTFEHHDGVLEVEAIDVGQGDSLLLITPHGKTILVDAGGFGGAPGVVHNFDVGEEVVSQALWARGLRRLDVVALTHAHGDHMGGMGAIIRNFRPAELWIGRNPPSPEYDVLLAEAKELGVGVRQHLAGEHFDFGGATVAVLSPASGYRPGAEPSNDDSLVMRFAYGKTSVLLEGDAERASEAQMLESADLGSTLLKVGHHGSSTSTSPPFLSAVAPCYAIISAGRHNSYGHPREETLQKLGDAHVLTYRTDTLGASSFLLDGKTITAHVLTAAGEDPGNGH
jgi:competence protein ComEC